MMTVLRRSSSSSNHHQRSSRLLSSTTMMTATRRRRILSSLATVAALSTTSGQAWVMLAPPPSSRATTSAVARLASSSSLVSPFHSFTAVHSPSSSSHTPTPTRLYHSSPLRRRNQNSNDDDSNNNGGLLDSIGKTAKSFLPKKWFGSQEEKAQLARKKEVKDQVKGSMEELLKDAPLGVRMMGKMVAPLMGNLASTMAEGFAEQQRTTETLLEDAQRYIMNDPNVVNAMGTPIQLGMPFSQSSSMSSVNGQTQSRVELALNIAGSKRSGIARILATNDGIAQLIVESGGKVFNVSLQKSKLGGSSSAKRKFGSGGAAGDDNIIEAEIIDKDTKR